MRKIIIVSGLLVALVVACSDDEEKNAPTTPAGITIADLVGTWDIELWEYSLAADTTQKADWVASGHVSGALAVTAEGLFTVSPALDAGVSSDFGTLTLQGDSIYWDGQNDEEWVRFSLNTTLTIRWPETSFVDMDHDGGPEDCWLRVVFSRQ